MDVMLSTVTTKSYAMMANIILNVVIITTSYIKYSMRLMSESKAASALDIVPEAQRKFTQHIKMLMSLAIAYTVCVLPTSLLCWGQLTLIHGSTKVHCGK